MRWAVIENGTNLVVNVVVWDGVSEWGPGDGYYVVQSDTLNIGDTYTP